MRQKTIIELKNEMELLEDFGNQFLQDIRGWCMPLLCADEKKYDTNQVREMVKKIDLIINSRKMLEEL